MSKNSFSQDNLICVRHKSPSTFEVAFIPSFGALARSSLYLYLKFSTFLIVSHALISPSHTQNSCYEEKMWISRRALIVVDIFCGHMLLWSAFRDLGLDIVRFDSAGISNVRMPSSINFCSRQRQSFWDWSYLGVRKHSWNPEITNVQERTPQFTISNNRYLSAVVIRV